MTEPARRRGDLAVPVATAAVTAAATAAVAWAAATPPATLSASATAPPASAAADQAHAAAATRRAGRDVWRAQRTLAAVRADLTRLMRVRLPHAKAGSSVAVVPPGLPPVQVNTPATTPVVVPAAPAPAPPPPAHTTTGASGATPP